MITAVIPSYNAAAYLPQAIESVLRQTRPAAEIIVVDDASTDGSAELTASYPVRLLRTDRNRGHGFARNLGIREARGDLLAWLDADDWWEADHLETVAGLLDRFPEAAVAYSRVEFVGNRQGGWRHFPCQDQPRHVFEACFRRTIVPAMAAVTRAGAAREIGGFDAAIRFAPDFDFWLRLSRRAPFVCTDRTTANYRWHGRQISRKHRAAQLKSIYAARRRMIAALLEDGEHETATRLQFELRDLWCEELQEAWQRGRTDRLRTLLSLAKSIPDGASEANLAWRTRAWLPGPLVRIARRASRRINQRAERL